LARIRSPQPIGVVKLTEELAEPVVDLLKDRGPAGQVRVRERS
jgi:hypothetical protein